MKNYYDLLNESSIEDIESYQNQLINSVNENTTNSKVDNIISEALGTEYKSLLKPFWLESNFNDDIWEIVTSKNKIKILNFKKVVIGNTNLTNDRKLVNTFKYWIISSLSPSLNNTDYKRKSTVHNRINIIITLINSIIIRSDKINLSNRKFLALDYNFLLIF